MQALLSFINIVSPIYSNSFLNNWHFFGEILRPLLRNTFNKSSNLAIWDFFDGVSNNRSSIIASQYFLLCKHSKMTLIYHCQIEGETFNSIGIPWYKNEVLPKYGNIPQYLFEFFESLKEWKASFKSNTDRTSHLELPNTENVSFNNR